LVEVIVAREIAAGVKPAQRNGKIGTLIKGLAHDVLKLFGVGRHFGSPRAKTSMTIMRAPQRGHAPGSLTGPRRRRRRRRESGAGITSSDERP
jgi:hypothetical protein